MTERSAQTVLDKLERHQDLKSEFSYFLDTGSIKGENAIEVEGFNAVQLQERFPHLKVIGIYMLLISLREDREHALDMISKNLPRK